MSTETIQKAASVIADKLRENGEPMATRSLVEALSQQEGMNENDLRRGIWLLITQGEIELNWDRKLVANDSPHKRLEYILDAWIQGADDMARQAEQWQPHQGSPFSQVPEYYEVRRPDGVLAGVKLLVQTGEATVWLDTSLQLVIAEVNREYAVRRLSPYAVISINRWFRDDPAE